MWLFLYVWTRELSKINGVWHQLKIGHYLFFVDMGKRFLFWFTWHICALWLPGKAWFSPRSRTYGAAAYLSCVSGENFVHSDFKKELGGGRNWTFSLVNRRLGLWKDLSVLRTCLALYPYLRALLCSFFHCFALSCWRDEKAVYSLVLGWENCRKT